MSKVLSPEEKAAKAKAKADAKIARDAAKAPAAAAEHEAKSDGKIGVPTHHDSTKPLPAEHVKVVLSQPVANRKFGGQTHHIFTRDEHGDHYVKVADQFAERHNGVVNPQE